MAVDQACYALSSVSSRRSGPCTLISAVISIPSISPPCIHMCYAFVDAVYKFPILTATTTKQFRKELGACQNTADHNFLFFFDSGNKGVKIDDFAKVQFCQLRGLFRKRLKPAHE